MNKGVAPVLSDKKRVSSVFHTLIIKTEQTNV